MWCWNDEPQFLGRWHESVALVFVFALFFGTEGEGEEEVVATVKHHNRKAACA